ncbi:MAG: glutathione-dependent reductase [Legionellales bacterium]|nr:glutathione-dependent reductase [Legionellales bacterium]
MGSLVNGIWTLSDRFSENEDTFERSDSVFRGRIDTQPQRDRYHLFVSYACPWAHRVLIMRALKGLEQAIGVSVVSPDMLDNGWTFTQDHPNTTGDLLYGHEFLYQLYQQSDKSVTSRVTVPVLWDCQKQTIVNNESWDILLILNTAFNHLTQQREDYYPKHQQNDINQWCDVIYNHINNGVYLCGFAPNQDAYNQAVKQLFSTLDVLEDHLADRAFIVGNSLTLVDLCLITTLIRFDAVYHGHFKCNLKRIIDYPNLHRYLDSHRSLDAIKSTTNLFHIKRHYYYSHRAINPSQIVPLGPDHY